MTKACLLYGALQCCLLAQVLCPPSWQGCSCQVQNNYSQKLCCLCSHALPLHLPRIAGMKDSISESFKWKWKPPACSETWSSNRSSLEPIFHFHHFRECSVPFRLLLPVSPKTTPPNRPGVGTGSLCGRGRGEHDWHAAGMKGGLGLGKSSFLKS